MAGFAIPGFALPESQPPFPLILNLLKDGVVRLPAPPPPSFPRKRESRRYSRLPAAPTVIPAALSTVIPA